MHHVGIYKTEKPSAEDSFRLSAETDTDRDLYEGSYGCILSLHEQKAFLFILGMDGE